MHKSSFEKLSHAAYGAGIFSLRYLKVTGIILQAIIISKVCFLAFTEKQIIWLLNLKFKRVIYELALEDASGLRLFHLRHPLRSYTWKRFEYYAINFGRWCSSYNSDIYKICSCSAGKIREELRNLVIGNMEKPGII
uniref:Uncharacterized protein n=1 Tax=Populus trichocarpa TaxID=3694 RepID=A0A2K1YUB5_POPTR